MKIEMQVENRRITVMGLGRHGGGVAVARHLARLGGLVTVTDLAGERQLSQSIESLRDEPIRRFRLGGHDEADFRQAEIVVVNPAVPPGNRFIQIARASGARITTDVDLLLAATDVPMIDLPTTAIPVIAVTGTTGKSTTATMIAQMLRQCGRCVHLGGNIGHSLLDDVDQIQSGDLIVLELSSFQLARLGDDARRPEVAVVTNCTANHLDWHGTFSAYRAAKQRLTHGPLAARHLVLGPGIHQTARWPVGDLCNRIDLPHSDEIPELGVPGEHNRANAACAMAAARAMGCDRASINSALSRFSGLPHRIQPLAGRDGLRWIDDSKATTPTAAIAALRAAKGRVWLLAGGFDKQADFGPLAEEIVRQTCGVGFFGPAGVRLADEVLSRSADLPHTIVTVMDDAVGWCRRHAACGAHSAETILLSPGCSSFDQFADYIERGKRFGELASPSTMGRKRD